MLQIAMQAAVAGLLNVCRGWQVHDLLCYAGVEVKFQDGSSVMAGLLIGADGYFSRMREQCLQDGPPSFGVS